MARIRVKMSGLLLLLLPILRAFPAVNVGSVMVVFSMFGHVTAGNIAAIIGGMTSFVIRVYISGMPPLRSYVVFCFRNLELRSWSQI